VREKVDTGLIHVDHLDEGDTPAVMGSNKRTKKGSKKGPKKVSKKVHGSIRVDKLELLRDDLRSLESVGQPDDKYLTQSEYDEVETELRTLAPESDNSQSSSSSSSYNSTSESPEQLEHEHEDALRREASEEAERKEKEIEYVKQRENEKDKLEDKMEAEVERDNGKRVDDEVRHDKQYRHLYSHPHVTTHHVSTYPVKNIVVDHVNIVDQERRVAELKAKISELEEPLKLQIEPDQAAVHALNYLKARLREMEEEGLHPTDSHRNNAREFLKAMGSRHVTFRSAVSSTDGCNGGVSGDCMTSNTSENDAPVSIATRITSFLPSGSLPTPCPVGITC